MKGSEVANESSLFSSENLVGGQQDSPLINSFQGLIDNEANKECGTQANIDNTLPVLPSSSAAAPVKDAWLTPDVAVSLVKIFVNMKRQAGVEKVLAA